MSKGENKNCFVIMPIADCDGYEKGHFAHVYDDIIKPAIDKTEFNAIRADEVKETNFIHLDILKKLIDAPIAVCDLSTRNPNVLFELGIRQAFDKPVVLIQEKGTPKIFDIAPLRYLEYSKEMKYHEVLESQKSLQEAIEATKAAEGDSGNINSIVKLMALSSPAIIPNLDNSNKEVLALDVMRSQMNDLKMMMEMMVHEGRKGISRRSSIAAIEYERIVNKLDKISSLKMDIEQADREYTKLMRDTEEIMMNCGGELDHRMFKYLMDKIYRQREEYFSTR
ncbi:hypothetical protein DXA51_02330 [Bacteroides caccae]|uniref:Uncharacterized protein n=1 Tax=Bacteroides caccae TaxID=47678 RepID=A0A413JC30_9BACE|nr:hypothetical protein [Bacteroides caccae]RGY17661.1 hypothetical protein DXA51_02330 [Bacteroides caccae]RGY29283.1 hypothetical protein DXA49_02895 [Bacteroides caccae]